MTQSDIHKKAMLEALEKSLGIVSVACKIVGISRNTHYEWRKNDAEYKEQVEGIDEVAIDFAETKLHKQIEKGDTTAIIFYLKTKGKRRGYIERQEIISANKNITVLFNDKDDLLEPDSNDGNQEDTQTTQA